MAKDQQRHQEGEGRTALGDTIQGVTHELKEIVGEFTKNTGQHDVERWQLRSCDERQLNKRSSLCSDDYKGRQFFREKIGVTPSIATPGDTNPSDVIGQEIETCDTRGHISITAQQLLRWPPNVAQVKFSLSSIPLHGFAVAMDIHGYINV